MLQYVIQYNKTRARVVLINICNFIWKISFSKLRITTKKNYKTKSSLWLSYV